ncbi:hypothetical protein O181_124196 [Austropuccinia psidii MF-1]|uniref:Uncharacterized protein n=1 Tax=Austropuccinia psidii MF-1 TaxID=1389203 RepID=A0A9Q3Q3Y3_9BASI|nr:hypothetical protein [Austropuccinia psidii MF-1]
MLKPERTDGGSREGEDSVSSVSLEIITRDYGSRRSQAIRLCTSSLKKSSRVWGHNSFYGLFKVLNLRDQSTIQDLPLISGEVTFLDGHGPPSMGPGHIGKNCIWELFFVPWTHEAPKNLGPGFHFGSGGLQ